MSAVVNPAIKPAPTGFTHQSHAQRIISHPGARLEVADELRALGCGRAIFVTGPRGNGHPAAAEIRTALWPMLADEFLEVDPRLPSALIASLASRAEAASVDAFVAFGGGACLDIAKAASKAVGQLRGGDAPVVVAIPSTLIGSEATSVPGCGARIVLYDAEVLARVGLSSVLASGMAAISHAVEALYARNDLLVETSACEALHELAGGLPVYRDDPHDVAAAQRLFNGAYMAGFSMARSNMSLAHGISRTLSSRTTVAYSVAHGIVLPHSMRYNTPYAVDRTALAGRAIGAAYRSEPNDDSATKAASAIERLVRALGLPGRLRDVGIEDSMLLPLAEAALGNPCMAANPRRIESAGQILSVLRSAY